ncbi:zinc ribbon domain-containing protein [Evansella clarkii]|uniref:zinc ribbon domain-containing protein n=1 Tax=Evansella clarkii TaxID=79879 RepID=UPI0009968B4A|nr:zinc ribbon domain-containing protein [Evansella clarkii]
MRKGFETKVAGKLQIALSIKQTERKDHIMSNDLQSKIGEGLSKFQGGIEQGKQKLHTTKEINRLKKIVQESALKKSEALIELGQLTYQKLRTGEITDSEFSKTAEGLTELDKEMYSANQNIAALSQSGTEGQVICTSCSAANGPDDKFCGGCGSKLEKESNQESAAGSCTACETTYPATANFCPCCGKKVPVAV